MNTTMLFASLLLLFSCSKKSADISTAMPNQEPINTGVNAQTYLALGDSYTIGEAVKQEESFPFQLLALLNGSGNILSQPKIIAKTGWTTSELQLAIKSENINSTFDMVTLLIGVNNQYRGNSKTVYRKEFKELLQQAIVFAKGDKKRVFVVSIPDWGVTPFGQGVGGNQLSIAQEIDAFNAINREETNAMQVAYIDITAASRNASIDLTLVASDGLHPSGKMYAEWAAKIAPAVKANFKE